ncbi:MAG: hypothetical protein R3331_08560 [Sulfurospirillaceae bacterium]|nr:hypothetical protein [Sulfurospirillaceae bacterium]
MLKIFLSIVCIYAVLFACEGDCLKCHQTLVKNGKIDENHQILTTCKNCHNSTPKDFEKMGAACGQDCWECHSVQKVMAIKIKQHEVLNNCIACHKKLAKDQGFLKLGNNGFSTDSIFKDLVK